MASTQSQQAYGLTTGATQTNFNWLATRDPSNTSDVNYPIGTFWQNTSVPKLWYLNSKAMVDGVLTVTWELISVASVLVSLSDTANTVVLPSLPSATPPDNIQLVGGTSISVTSTPASNLITIAFTGSANETLTGNDGVAVTPIGGTIQTLGATVANNTYMQALYTNNPSGNIEQFNIQLSTAIAATDATLAKVGVSVFDSAQFGVDANGFVTLAGGTGAAVQTLIGDDTLSVTPTSGAITLKGVTVTSGSHAKPVYFARTSAYVEEVDVQVTTTSASGAKDINNAGLASFDSAFFTVDAPTGFVSIASGTGLLETLTTSDSNTVTPSSGNINLFGTGSITTVGSVSTATVELTGLTNHAVLVGAGSATITKIAATANTGAVLQNNSGGDPSYSTATYPSTTTINQLLYSSSANVVAGLATANSSSLVTNSTGIPSWQGPMTNGQLIIGSTGATPTAATITAGSGISVTNGAGSITIAATGTGELLGLTVDATSGGGTNPVVPNGSGDITLIGGALFSTGSVAFPIRVVSTAANTASLQIQEAGTNHSSPATNNYGVAQFESVNFTASAGFVTSNAMTLTAGPGITLSTTSLNLGGSLTISSTGSSFTNYTNVNHASGSPYTVLLTDQYISCDAASGLITLKFPNAPTAYQEWTVKDRTGGASTNNISITTVGGGDTIDGLTTYPIASNYGSVRIIYNGTNYEVF